ncbi:MAG: hypothetical protein H7289_06955 [Mucilaginibacter sp.]|nr:hypothetical protein [Mucilaginibacter sp.]
MKTTSFLSLAFVAFLAISSCTKSAPATPDNTGTTGTTGPTSPVLPVKATPDPGVYFVGVRQFTDALPDVYYQATLWKNNFPITISTAKSYAWAITVQDTSIYVAGYEGTTACYWKNGNIVKLTQLPVTPGVTQARAIAVQGNDVHIAGSTYSDAFYWKNGSVSILPSPNKSSSAYGMVLKGSDVYICGYYATSTGQTACYWKNGVINTFNDNSIRSIAYGIAVADNGDVSVVGYRLGTLLPYSGLSGNNIPTVWKNSVPTALPITNAGGMAMAVTTKGNDVYTAGYGEDKPGTGAGAVYWKNNVPTYIANSSTTANSIFVAGDEVHIAGVKKLEGTTTAAASWNTGVIYGQSLISVFNGVYVVK